MHTHALTHVCTQVPSTTIVVNTAALGPAILSKEDRDLLGEPEDLKWAPPINKRTKKKKGNKTPKKQKKKIKASAHTKTHAHMYISCCIRWNFLYNFLWISDVFSEISVE